MFFVAGFYNSVELHWRSLPRRAGHSCTVSHDSTNEIISFSILQVVGMPTGKEMTAGRVITTIQIIRVPSCRGIACPVLTGRHLPNFKLLTNSLERF
jgi:hypothetical protein